MFCPAQVAVKKGPQIVHAIFQHSQPVDTAAECKALPDIGVQPAVADDIGVNHAGAQDLHPAAFIAARIAANDTAAILDREARSEERRVGKECKILEWW